MSTVLVTEEKQKQKAPGLIGKQIDRVDGRLKVTGGARYTAEYDFENLAYGIIIQSTIANGRIIKIDTAEAEKAPGVLGVMTHENAPRLSVPKYDWLESAIMEDFIPLQDDKIYYGGQAIGVVVADTLEHALYGANLVKVSYEEEKPIMVTLDGMPRASKPESLYGLLPGVQASRGDVAKALVSSPDGGIKKIERTYTIPVEHHNPMETHASIVLWEGDRLTLYDSTQWVHGTRNVLSAVFGIPKENVRVISFFTGGAFGSKLAPVASVEFLAAAVARELDRPVKLVLSRQQMFSLTGHRPGTIQKISLAASPRDSKLIAIRHDTICQASPSRGSLRQLGLPQRRSIRALMWRFHIR